MIQSLNRKKLTIGNTAVEMDRIFCQFCYPVSGQISNSISYRISGLRSNWVSLIFYHLYYHGVWGEGNANPLFAACPLSFLIINLHGCGYPCDIRFSKVWFTIPPPSGALFNARNNCKHYIRRNGPNILSKYPVSGRWHNWYLDRQNNYLSKKIQTWIKIEFYYTVLSTGFGSRKISNFSMSRPYPPPPPPPLKLSGKRNFFLVLN